MPASLPLATTALDVGRFVTFTPDPAGARWEVGPGDKRAGQVGTCLGIIGFRHASGYEVVLQLDNGRIDSFAPLSLLPARGQ